MSRHDPVSSPYLVPFDGSFRIKKAPTEPPKRDRDDDKNVAALEASIDKLRKLQARLYAEDEQSLLIVLQAMDAAGKDGTLNAVMSGVNPAGVEVYAFKAPTIDELDHDFLWRVYRCMPQRGRIGIFNRSYYEEVLVVRAHPELVLRQRLPHVPPLPKLWEQRYESMREMERHLARNGTRVLKIWLNVSRDEQRRRLLDRAKDPEANWKFRANDVDEREHWKEFMEAYEDALNATSRPFAPWYAVPADDKKYMRRVVADLIVRTLADMDPKFPTVSPDERAAMDEAVRKLEEENA